MKIQVHKCRSKGFKPAAWIIMLFQSMNPFKSSSYNHFSISYDNIDGQQVFADSTFAHGLQINQSLYEYISRYTLIETMDLDLTSEPIFFRSWLGSYKDSKYDVAGIIGLAFKILHVFKRNPFGSNFKKMTCNELILLVLESFKGVKVGDPDNYDLLMTAKLLERL